MFLPSLMVRSFAIIDSKKDLLKSQLYNIALCLSNLYFATLPLGSNIALNNFV
jgi:hypothetical protein